MQPTQPSFPAPPDQDPRQTGIAAFLHRIFFGGGRNLADQSLFTKITLIPFLAWVGFGADGLSSSSYGPEEGFKALQGHTYLAPLLAGFSIFTIFTISAAYNRIIRHFPHGGGGYVVANQLLGPIPGVTAGSALLVDYVLTITTSIAAAGDAFFSLSPEHSQYKLLMEAGLILFLTILNLRGIKESVLVLAPVFLLFLVSHVLLISGSLAIHGGEFPRVQREISEGFHHGYSTLGLGGMAMLLMYAYSLGGGTYTGIEAVSNGLGLMREPKVENGHRTMFYMAVSLSFMAGGLLLCYLLWNTAPAAGKTMNAVLAEQVSHGFVGSGPFVIVILVTEGAILLVAAQAGFFGGPRILAKMANDSWAPHRFTALSERLTTSNGILLMALLSFAALIYTGGDILQLVVMYSINVFITFFLSMLGMMRLMMKEDTNHPHWLTDMLVFTVGLVLCGTILIVTVYEKFSAGGWVTLVATTALVSLAVLVRAHYRYIFRKVNLLFQELENISHPEGKYNSQPVDPSHPVAAVLVARYGGLGIHTVLGILRSFPHHYKSLVFISVGVVDTEGFSGASGLRSLERETLRMLDQYVQMARAMGIPAAHRHIIGTDPVADSVKLAQSVAGEFPNTVFFSGRLIFDRERWFHRILHNETAYAIQRRLQWRGLTMVIMPARVP
ncbi:MAG: APC family permease [Deltaproteobacteria bacterium]|nr:APC family permease [Deltaproteobacteria bacterium]